MIGVYQDDVIAAIATPPGRGAIGVVRISGTGAAEVLSKIFESKSPDKSHMLRHGYIHDRGCRLDEVLCAVMRAPRSYTHEDTAEIYCHGGTQTVQAVLAVVLKYGARPAEPGEFTKRAFLNGRLDLTQAEAVMELIDAKSEYARQAGLRRLGGGLSERINRYRDIILKWLAHIELSVDYPEHESEAMNLTMIRTECIDVMEEIKKLQATARVGRIITEGVSTAIVGRPNVGKSSLMNAILHEERAIVTDVPGTTRDVLSETVNIHEIPIRLMDTAGIRATDDAVERLGVERSLIQAQEADLILLVLDRSEPPQPEDKEIIARLAGRPVISLFNKSDLPPAEGWKPELLQCFEYNLQISAKQGDGMDALYSCIKLWFMDGLEGTTETDIITHARHQYLLEQVLGYLQNAMTTIEAGYPEDLVAIDLRAAYAVLGELIGRAVGDDVLDRIFSEFCVGK